MVFDGSNREHQHIFVAVEVDLADPAHFLFAYIHDLDATGIFVRTTEPEAPGTRLNVRLTTGSHGPYLAIDGQVVWVNPYRPDDNDNLSPGMAVRFLDLTNEQRSQLIALIKCIAYLDEPRPSSHGDTILQ